MTDWKAARRTPTMLVLAALGLSGCGSPTAYRASVLAPTRMDDPRSVSTFLHRVGHHGQAQAPREQVPAAQSPADTAADAPSTNAPLLLFGGVAVVLFVIVGVVLLARRK